MPERGTVDLARQGDKRILDARLRPKRAAPQGAERAESFDKDGKPNVNAVNRAPLKATPQSNIKVLSLGSRLNPPAIPPMALTVSPYLSAPQTAASPAPARAETRQSPGAASSAATDSVRSVAGGAAGARGHASPTDAQKTPLQATLERILASVRNATGPTLTFRPATDSQTGKTLDQSC